MRPPASRAAADPNPQRAAAHNAASWPQISWNPGYVPERQRDPPANCAAASPTHTVAAAHIAAIWPQFSWNQVCVPARQR